MQKFYLICAVCGSENVKVNVVLPEEEIKIACECGNEAKGNDEQELGLLQEGGESNMNRLIFAGKRVKGGPVIPIYPREPEAATAGK